MRGRTNITQRSGTVPVNGDIKEFEVAEGNEINIGDFVSYKVKTSTSKLFDAYGSITFWEYLGGNYYAFILNNSLYLLKYENETVNVVFIYNDYIVKAFSVLQDGSLICCVEKSPYVIRLRVNGDELIFLNSAGSDANGVNSPNYCFVYENNFCVIYSSSGSIYSYFYNLDESFNINYISYTSSKLQYSNISRSVCNFANIGKDVYFMWAGGTSSTAQHYWFLNKLRVDFENNTSSTGSIYTNIIEYKKYKGGFLTPLIFNDKYYVIIYEPDNYSSTEETKILIYNINSNTKTEQLLKNLGFNYTSRGLIGIQSKIFDNNKFALLFDMQVAILEFNEDVSEVNLISNILTIDARNSSGIILKNDLSFSLIMPGSSGTISQELNCNESYNFLSQFLDKSFVTNYDGSSLSIGFAKTKGSPGDIIQVYVPKSN